MDRARLVERAEIFHREPGYPNDLCKSLTCDYIKKISTQFADITVATVRDPGKPGWTFNNNNNNNNGLLSAYPQGGSSSDNYLN